MTKVGSKALNEPPLPGTINFSIDSNRFCMACQEEMLGFWFQVLKPRKKAKKTKKKTNEKRSKRSGVSHFFLHPSHLLEKDGAWLGADLPSTPTHG